MKNHGWIALILAVVFPSVALIIVVLSGPRRGEVRHAPPPMAGSPSCGGPKSFQPPPFGNAPGGGPKGPMVHGSAKPPVDVPRFEAIARELSLSKAQIQDILKIEKETRAKEDALMKQMMEKEKKVHELMMSENPKRDAILTIMKEIADLRLKTDMIRMFRPLDIKKLLTKEQREKLEKAMMLHRPGMEPGHGGGGPMGPHGRGGPGMHSGHGGPDGHPGHGGPGRRGGPGGPGGHHGPGFVMPMRGGPGMGSAGGGMGAPLMAMPGPVTPMASPGAVPPMANPSMPSPR